MLPVKLFLQRTTTLRFGKSLFQTLRHHIGKENHRAVHVAACSPHRLNQAAVISQKSFFVRVQNSDQRNLGQVQSFAKKIDSDKDVKIPFSQTLQQFMPFQSFNVAVQIAGFDIHRSEKVRQILRHFFSQRSHQRAFIASGNFRNAF